ncbi:MAG: NACHT domain-containing protein [Ktedonobacteraceae bacterium]|nr:NACHT domain-containing protein [Ktedonobacteraceae bacterium]
MSDGIHTNVETFSSCVQKYLRASGYSQKELAEALSLHPKVLSRKLNGSGSARLTHQEIQRVVIALAGWHAITAYDEALHLLTLVQKERSLFSEDEWQTPPLSTLTTKLSHTAPVSTPPPQHNFAAQVTRLIGRDWAIERLRNLLQREDVRLVTLVGAGGSGKTRLAQYVACELVESFVHGAWFVPLAPVSDPTQMPMSIIQALNIQAIPNLTPLQSLITTLKKRQLLLVLDNFEQLQEATPLLDELLAGVPGLKVLVTSRVVLHLYGERELSVPPLDLPDSYIVLDKAELVQYGAIQLFVERAQAVQPHFVLTNKNAATVMQICVRLDGLPLALELAAARMKVLSPEALFERLAQARLPVLTKGARNVPERQQTLRDTIAWSYDLLSPMEQRWFRRLGIFVGSWSLEAAEAMMQEAMTDQNDANALDMLERLLDNSLVTLLPDTQTRFTMLETLREYALEQLQSREELERLRDWHACYYLRNAEAAERGIRGPEQLTWLAELTTDRDNFRAAMEWSLQGAREGLRIPVFPVAVENTLAQAVPDLSALELYLRLTAAFRPYWEWQGYLAEARYWLGSALQVSSGDDASATVQAARAKALSEAARLACLENDQPRAVALAEESIQLWKRLDDPEGLATAHLHRAWTAYATSEYEIGQLACQEGLRVLARRDNPWLRGQLLFYLGTAAGFMGDFELMRSLYTQARNVFEQVGDRSAVADVLKDQGAMMILESKYAEAIDSLLKSVQLCYKLDHKQYITTGLCWLSVAFGMRGVPDPAQASLYAAQLQGAADNLMETIGLTPWTNSNAFVQMVHQYICSLVDEQQWAEAWTFGHSLTVGQAIDLAGQFL